MLHFLTLTALKIVIIPVWFNALYCMQATPTPDLNFVLCSFTLISTPFIAHLAGLKRLLASVTMASFVIFWVPSGVPQLLALSYIIFWIPYFYLTPTVYLLLPVLWLLVLIVLFTSTIKIERMAKRKI